MLKVMTLNLNYYSDRYGSWTARRELVGEAVRAGSPDVIAFQAVARDPSVEGGRDQAAQIAEIFPEYEHVFFQPALTLLAGGEQGSAILSRISWQKTQSKELTLIPGLEDSNRRVLLSAEFDLSAGRFNLFNGHFSWVTEQGRLNVEEAFQAVEAAQGFKMLVGDLNITPESGLLEPLAAGGWIDVWSDLRPQENGFTFLEDGLLAKRIDYVWVNRELRPYVEDVQIVADSQYQTGARVSDHVGLLVVLNLDSARTSSPL